MTRRPPCITQAEIARAIRAVVQVGLPAAIVIEPDGTISVAKLEQNKGKEWPALEHEEEDSGHFIYVISGDEGLVKIGISCDVNRRANELQLYSLGPLIVVHKLALKNIYIARQLERDVHIVLRENRVYGEWFNISKVEAISAIHSSAKRLGYLQ